MRTLIFLVGLAFGLPGLGATVKVESDRCDGGVNVESSGVAFRDKKNAFVLASAGRTFFGGCHRTTFQGQAYTMQLVANRWGRGLRLFKVPGLKVDNLLEWKQLVSRRPPRRGDPVRVTGVSTGESQPKEVSAFQVQDPRSERHSFPFLPSVLEVRGSLLPTWVGGGIWNEAGRLVGFVSDQHLKMVPGMFVRPVVTAIPGKVARQWLGLPAWGWSGNWVRDWVAQDSPFRLRAESQLDPPQVVDSGGLRFSAQCPPPGSPGSGGPIGGGDGVGIGGANTKAPYCAIVVTPSSAAIPWALPGWAQWQRSTIAALKKGRSVRIPFLFTRQFGALRVVPVWGVGDFFRALSNPGNRIHTQVDPRPKSKPWFDLATRAKRVQGTLAQWHTKHYYSLPQIPILLKRAYLTLELVSGEAREDVKASDIEVLLDKTYSWPWTNLRTWYPKEVKFIRDELRHIQTHLGSR